MSLADYLAHESDAQLTNDIQTDKLTNLTQKRNEKLQRLGTQNQGANLQSGTFSVTDDGLLESNANKIWNPMTDVNVQDMLSDAANQSITQGDDGKYYQTDAAGNLTEYTGDMRRAYMFGTKGDSGAVKFGLARGDLPGSEYRYQPGRAEAEGYKVGRNGYGWDSGEGGVDVNKNYMDMLLPYNVATALEGAVHGRQKALENRQYKNVLSGDALGHASGTSEYYNSPEGLLGDTSQATNEQLEAGDTDLLAQYSGIPEAPNKYARPSVADVMGDAGGSNGGRLDNMVDAVQFGLGRKAAGITDWIVDTGIQLATEVAKLDGVTEKEFNARLKDSIKGTFMDNHITADGDFTAVDKFKEAVTYDYDNTRTRELMANVGDKWDQKDWVGLAGAVVEGIVTAGPELAGESSGEIITGALGKLGLVFNTGDYTNQILEERQKIVGELGVEDRTIALVGGLGMGMLNKLGADEIIGNSSVVRNLIGAVGATGTQTGLSTLKSVIGKLGNTTLYTGGKGLYEGFEEVAQEAINVVAEVYGTEEQDKILSSESGKRLTQALAGGVAAGAAMTAPKAVGGVTGAVQTGLEGVADAGERRADEKRQKMSDDIVDEKVAAQKSKENVYGGEAVEPTEGFKTPEYIKTQVVDDEGYYNALEDEKQAVVSSLFEVANGSIVGLSEEGSKLSEADRATKFDEIKGWLDTYKEDYTVEGKVPKGVQDEVNIITAEANKDYLADTAVDTGVTVEPTEAEVAAEEKMTEKVKEKNAFTAVLDEAETEEGRVELLKKIVSGQVGYEVDDKVATEVAERVNAEYKKYQVSGFAQDMDWREVVKEYADKSGVKGQTRGKAQSRKEERNDRLAIDNEAVNTVMKGEIETLEQVGTDSKTDAQVVQKLSKDNLKSADNIKTLKELDSKMEELIASVEGKELSKKMFKSGDKEGNSKRAMLIGINTINAQVQSDTQQRQAIEYDLERGPGGLEGDLKKDEYLAGREATAVQIGKDYVSSYGIQLEGSPEQVYKRYKDFGNEVLDMLEKAGIAETVEGPMWSKLSDNLVEEDVKNRHYVNRPVIDSVTKKQGVVYKDRGIKLTDTKGMADKYAGTINDPYTSKYGDVAKRVAKLLLPGSILAPQEEPAKGEPEVANGVKLYKNADEKKDVASIMKALHGKSVQIKAEFLDVLDKINTLKGDKTIHQAVRDNPEIAGLLGLQETGAKLLATSENGINNTNLQGLSDILDNLEVFQDENGKPKKVYFEYQTDINNRITLLQTIANFQSDKAMSRRMFTGGDAVAVEGPALNFLVNSLIEEFGMLSPKANSKKDYDRLVKAILNGDYRANETLGKLKQYVDALRVRDLNLDEISEGANDFGFEGKGMEFYGLIIALEEVAGTKGVGVTTTYMAEMDASASGVVNTMLNIAGRDSVLFQEILRQLNITVKDRVPTVEELVDAYSMLSDKVDENFANSIKTTKKVAVKTLVDELDSLGVNIRTLAKPVVMTWFYSAGAPAIQRELTSMVTTAVVKAAIKDNKEGEAARALIERVLGKPYSIAMVKNIEPGSEEHIKLVNEFNQLGDTYNSTLKDAFPQVEAYKEDMEEMFGALDQYGKITDGHDGKPKEFWKGRIRSAFAALNSDLREMGKDGFTSLYKRKLKAIDKATNDELMMITEMMANISSTLPLHAHNIDAAQLLTALAEVVFEDDVQGMLTVHDAIYANPNTLLRLQEAYNKSAIDIALKYDMLDNMVLSAEWTIGEMEAYLKEHGSNASVEENIKALTKVTDVMREKNQKFMEAKADLLKGAKAKVFGVQDVEKAKGAGEVKAGPKVEKKVEPKPKDEETKEPEVDTSTVFDEVPTVEDAVAAFVAKPSQESIKTMLNELLKFDSSNRGRVSRIIGDIDSKVESLDFKVATDADRTKFGQTGVNTSFMVMSETGKSTIYIGESVSKSGDVNQVIDEIAHEIEHVVSNRKVEEMSKAGKDTQDYRAYEMLKRTVDKIGKWTPTNRTEIQRRLANIKTTLEQDGEIKAIQELVATYNGEESVREELLNELNRSVKIAGVKGVLEYVRQAISKLINGTIKLDKEFSEGFNTGNIAVAAAYVAQEARGFEVDQVTDIDATGFAWNKDCKI